MRVLGKLGKRQAALYVNITYLVRLKYSDDFRLDHSLAADPESCVNGEIEEDFCIFAISVYKLKREIANDECLKAAKSKVNGMDHSTASVVVVQNKDYDKTVDKAIKAAKVAVGCVNLFADGCT